MAQCSGMLVDTGVGAGIGMGDGGHEAGGDGGHEDGGDGGHELRHGGDHVVAGVAGPGKIWLNAAACWLTRGSLQVSAWAMVAMRAAVMVAMRSGMGVATRSASVSTSMSRWGMIAEVHKKFV